MATIQDTVGRLAMARENVMMGQKKLSEVMQFFFQRETESAESLLRRGMASPNAGLDGAIERLELAIHDLKVVQRRVKNG